MFFFICQLLAYVFFGNINSTIKHFLLKDPDQLKTTYFKYSFAILIVSTLIFMAIKTVFIIDIKYAVFSIALGASIFLENYILGIRKYSISAKYNIAKSIIELILIYFFIAFGLGGFELRYYPLIFTLLLTLIIFVLIIMRVSKETIRPQTQRLSVKRVLTFSSSILIHTCLMIFFNQSNRYFVGEIHSEELSGYYSVLHTIGNVIFLVSMFYNSIMIDKFYGFKKEKNRLGFGTYINDFIKTYSMVSTLIYLGIFLTLPLLLDTNYIEYDFIILSMFTSNIFFILYQFFSADLNYYENHKAITIKSFFAVILGLMISVFLIFKYQLLGAAISIAVYNFLLFIFYFNYKYIVILDLRTVFFAASNIIIVFTLYINNTFGILSILLISLIFCKDLKNLKWKSLF